MMTAVSAAEVGEKPQDKGKTDADEDGCGDGEIEGGVLAAMDDVAGEVAQAEGEAGVEIEQDACDAEGNAQD
jgi:hypothetical protein